MEELMTLAVKFVDLVTNTFEEDDGPAPRAIADRLDDGWRSEDFTGPRAPITRFHFSDGSLAAVEWKNGLILEVWTITAN
jgi:hypothetical protein